MKTESKTLNAHLFVCTHIRDEGESCGSKGSADLVSELKGWVKENKLKDTVKVTRSGCLGLCENGIAAVCYPKGEWMTDIKRDDGEKLKTTLK